MYKITHTTYPIVNEPQIYAGKTNKNFGNYTASTVLFDVFVNSSSS